MRVHYDADVDAFYLRLVESKIVDSQEVTRGVVVDFGANDEVVGIEVLDFKHRLVKANLLKPQ